MKIVLKRLADPKGHVKIIEIAGGTDKIPAALSYESQQAAVNAAAQYLGLMADEFDEVEVRD